jgi:hypothetical protein
MSSLETVGAVRADYVHIPKFATPAPLFAADGVALKWYDIAPIGSPVPGEIHELARAGMHDGVVSGQLALEGELGFVILHRCGESFYFLLITTWKNENELWETVWAKDGPDDPVFSQWPASGTHRPVFCVWELGAVCHERRAWSEYLYSARDVSAREAYLARSFRGDV